MIKIKDSEVLNISFFIMNHFQYGCMGREGRSEGIYQNVRLRVHRGHETRVFAYVRH